MTQWIRQREHHEETTHYLFFQEKGRYEGSGYAFRCDGAGVLEHPEREPRAAELRADPAFDAPVVLASVHRWTTPAAIRCRCGREVELDRFTNACECGRDYNMSGQELVPREQWGEETGEHWTDLVRF